MSVDSMQPGFGAALSGMSMYELARSLFPFCRSITGDGVRATLKVLQAECPVVLHEVRSGEPVFDWKVPLEWNISDAYIKNLDGERIVDFRSSNLHVMSYSTPVRGRMTLDELRPHLFTLPDHPDWVPYRTSYYKENWGFCLSHRHLLAMRDAEYDVCIDSRLEKGSLTYGECLLAGQSTEEVLMSCHVCHPSLANDNLSGIAVATALARSLATRRTRYSYRFLFIPGTIGSITWLARNEAEVARIKHGLVLTGVGDRGGVTYKRSRRGRADIDRAMEHVLTHSGEAHRVIDFFPYGYDERQFCSPGFDLPVGCFMRTPHGEYPEYHSSADNLDFIQPESLWRSYELCLAAIEVLEHNRVYRNQNPKCEPQLGRRGLYRAVAGQQEKQSRELTILWVLNLSDGQHSLLDIAERASLPFHDVRMAAEALTACDLLREVPSSV
ncbi:peptidase M28 [Nitrospira sp.]|nr:peptidase M28 [Nitrospira sp.]